MLGKTVCFLLLLSAVGPLGAADPPVDLPFGIPPDLYQFVTPEDNPTTKEKVALGEKLYHDVRLSADNTVSCATCHDSAKGFTDQLPTSKGIRDQFGKRNAPTVLNAMFLDSQFLDGRAADLEEQAKMPLVNPIEMGLKDGDEVVAKVKAIPEYAAAFQKVFGRPVNYDDVGRAIAAFERTVLSGNAAVDRFMAGQDDALTASARRGWTLFNGKGRCNTCHAANQSYPFFTDSKFHNIGVAARSQDFDMLAAKAEHSIQTGDVSEIDRLAIETDMSQLGRYLVTKNRADIGAFKTPNLRDIVLTFPYMHDGSLATLWDVMDHYNKGGELNPFLDGGIIRLGLSEAEIDDLVALMFAFTSDVRLEAAKTELERQRKVAASNRPIRDVDIAMGKKGNFGDVPPDPTMKDPALIGGRPPVK
jgi:cytochrome c peroxidase